MKIVNDTYEQLYDFQVEGVDFLARSRSALLADDVGTGKTAQGIHACQQVGARSVLVICTASIKYNWKKEAVKWGYDGRDIHILTKENIEGLPPHGMFIINYDLCWRKEYAGFLLRRNFDVLICDEAHYLKNHNAKRAKAVWLRKGYADISTYRWMITATPVLNRPVELHAMLKKLCPDRLGGYKNFIAYAERYCNGHQGKWGYDTTGADNLDELAGRLDGFMLRRTRDEVMPDKTLQKLYLPFTKEIEKYLFTGEENESIRRKIGLGKVVPSAEHIKNILESEDKVVVFGYHTDVLLGLEEALSDYSPVVLRGATPGKQRQEYIDKFQADPGCRVFIGQIQAAGEGIDGLQHASSVAVFVEIAHTPGIIKQAMGRISRQGQEHSCLFQFLLVEGTVDEEVLSKTVFKDKNIKEIMKDEKLGLDFSKQKEEDMSEVQLKRIADALEKLVGLKGAETVITLSGDLEASEDALSETQPTQPKAKSKSQKKRVAVQKEEVTVMEITDEMYQFKMKESANSISTSNTDPAKTNAIFAKLQATFQKAYPNYAHVFTVEAKDYADVIKLVGDFLVAEGV